MKEAAMMVQHEEALPVLPAKKLVVTLQSLMPIVASDTADSHLDDTTRLTPKRQFR